MCLTTEAFALFLAVLSPEIVDAGADRVTINASAERTIWQRTGIHWCLSAGPQVPGETDL